MNINDYVKSLKGIINKEDVQKNLDTVIQVMSSKTLVLTSTAAASFKTITFKSKEVLSFEERYRNNFRLGRNASMFGDIHERMSKEVMANLQTIRTLVEKTMPETVSATTIDHRSATLLQLVDNAGFLDRFTRRLIETVSVYETQATGMYDNYQKDNLTLGEAEWLTNRISAYMETLKAFSDSESEFKKKFDSIPMVQVDTTGQENNKLFGLLRMDPFKMGFIPVWLNPCWYLGKWWVEYQHSRYKEAQEDLVRVQQRMLLLEEALAGKANPKLEKELELQRKKAEGLIYKINKAEEDL